MTNPDIRRGRTETCPDRNPGKEGEYGSMTTEREIHKDGLRVFLTVSQTHSHPVTEK